MKTLEMKEMARIEGGVSREEYCATLQMLWEHNVDTWDDEIILAAAAAAGMYCGGIL